MAAVCSSNNESVTQATPNLCYFYLWCNGTRIIAGIIHPVGNIFLFLFEVISELLSVSSIARSLITVPHELT